MEDDAIHHIIIYVRPVRDPREPNRNTRELSKSNPCANGTPDGWTIAKYRFGSWFRLVVDLWFVLQHKPHSTSVAINHCPPKICPRSGQRPLLRFAYMAGTTLPFLFGCSSPSIPSDISWTTNSHSYCTWLSHCINLVGWSYLGCCTSCKLWQSTSHREHQTIQKSDQTHFTFSPIPNSSTFPIVPLFLCSFHLAFLA